MFSMYVGPRSEYVFDDSDHIHQRNDELLNAYGKNQGCAHHCKVAKVLGEHLSHMILMLVICWVHVGSSDRQSALFRK